MLYEAPEWGHEVSDGHGYSKPSVASQGREIVIQTVASSGLNIAARILC
jgi:hypothetical protein